MAKILNVYWDSEQNSFMSVLIDTETGSNTTQSLDPSCIYFDATAKLVLPTACLDFYQCDLVSVDLSSGLEIDFDNIDDSVTLLFDSIAFRDGNSFVTYLAYEENFQIPTNSTPPPALSSLNGDLKSHVDGSMVKTYPDDSLYSVVRSYLVMNDADNHTIVYDLISSDNKRVSVPHAMTQKAI